MTSTTRERSSVSARLEAIEAHVAWLMDRDRKSTGLKELQGQIWEVGYARGDLVGAVFPDVPVALSRWHADHRLVCIFWSGSTHAQRLLFQHSSAGDLTPYLTAYFDTTTGPKAEPSSYERIAENLLEKLIGHMKSRPGEWFATHEQIARHVKALMP